MRSKGAHVFIPGNHDWDKGGKRTGKIKQEWYYLEELNDSLLKLLPPLVSRPTEIIFLTNWSLLCLTASVVIPI